MSQHHNANRVLLLGATGNLGSRLLVSLLAHRLTVIALVRSPTKLASLIAPGVLSHPDLTVIEGDATDSAAIRRALEGHDCGAVADVAGNQVAPWREPVLQRIVAAVVDAAAAVGRARGRPLRLWVIGGIGSLRYPGRDGFLIQDYMPNITTVQHQSTVRILDAVPVSEVRWSCLCVGMMTPALSRVTSLVAQRRHSLVLKADALPEWVDSWFKNIPFVGDYLNLLLVIPQYTTELENVADFLAEDLESGSTEWVGRKVGMKQKEKGL